MLLFGNEVILLRYLERKFNFRSIYIDVTSLYETMMKNLSQNTFPVDAIANGVSSSSSIDHWTLRFFD